MRRSESSEKSSTSYETQRYLKVKPLTWPPCSHIYVSSSLNRKMLVNSITKVKKDKIKVVRVKEDKVDKVRLNPKHVTTKL